MRLRNKKTGEIAEPFGITCVNGRTFVQFEDEKGKFKYEAHSLAELNEEWEDVLEEPKEFWYIDCNGAIRYDNDEDTEFANHCKQIGNYFETKEEAENAVEKLKAWKRLKDKGFKFIGVRGIGKVIDFDIPKPYTYVWFDEYNPNKDGKEFYDDLFLLFGGE